MAELKVKLQMTEPFNYEAARAELEKILEELEKGEAGIDALAGHVRRAGELIRLCRNKLRETDQEIKKILGEFDEGPQ